MWLPGARSMPAHRAPPIRRSSFDSTTESGARASASRTTSPPLAWLLKACKTPDGSYWALQSWVRLKRNYGGTTGAEELHLSHWRGPLAVLTVYQNWAERRYRHLFGRLTYNGVGVYGFTATGRGAPLDGYGRNVYVDTFDSRYGRGWHRENGFLTHHRGRRRFGDFCYGFFRTSGIRPARAPSTARPRKDRE